jgi:nitrogen regulatory protein P-II 1
MKRIEAIIPNEKISSVSEAFKKAGIGGCTILEAKGRGKGEKPMVQSGRGTSRFVSEFSVRAIIVTVVPDSQVENVVSAILDSVSTGSAGDGKIFISAVSDTIDIGTRQRGDEAVI